MIIKSSIHVFTFFTYNSSNCILIQRVFFFGKAYDADAIVQAAYAASSTGVFVSANRRTCGGTQATCDAICGSAISGMRDTYGKQGSTTYVSINLFVFNRKRVLIFFILTFHCQILSQEKNLSAVHEVIYYKSIITTEVIYKQFHKFSRSCIISFVRFQHEYKDKFFSL